MSKGNNHKNSSKNGASKSDRKHERKICVPNKGPYNKDNPRVCTECGEPMSKADVGKRKCDGAPVNKT